VAQQLCGITQLQVSSMGFMLCMWFYYVLGMQQLGSVCGEVWLYCGQLCPWDQQLGSGVSNKSTGSTHCYGMKIVPTDGFSVTTVSGFVGCGAMSLCIVWFLSVIKPHSQALAGKVEWKPGIHWLQISHVCNTNYVAMELHASKPPQEYQHHIASLRLTLASCEPCKLLTPSSISNHSLGEHTEPLL